MDTPSGREIATLIPNLKIKKHCFVERYIQKKWSWPLRIMEKHVHKQENVKMVKGSWGFDVHGETVLPFFCHKIATSLINNNVSPLGSPIFHCFILWKFEDSWIIIALKKGLRLGWFIIFPTWLVLSTSWWHLSWCSSRYSNPEMGKSENNIDWKRKHFHNVVINWWYWSVIRCKIRTFILTLFSYMHCQKTTFDIS